MEEQKFRKKYKGIKMRLLVPKLENQVKTEINRRLDWTEKCFDIEENAKNKMRDLIVERRYLFFLIILLVLGFCLDAIMLLIWRIT